MPMRQLHSCDFCGEEAAGVYEAVPPELSPTETEQRRVALCPACRETLEAVVDPLLARLGVDIAAADSSSTAADPTGAAEPTRTDTAPSGSEPLSPASVSGPDDADDADETGDTDYIDDIDVETVEEPDPGTRERSEGVGVDSADSIDGGGIEAAASGDTEAVDADDAETADDGTVAWNQAESRNGTDTTVAASDTETTPETADDAVSDVADPLPTAGTGDGGSAEPDDAELAEPESVGGDPGEEPEEFRTVMRLLGNREFPVEKSEILELAASAYQLDEAHVERILDHAVARDVLDVDGDTLRRP